LAAIVFMRRHKHSLGLRSGDFAEVKNPIHPWASIHYVTTNLYRWQNALSSWNIQFFSSKQVPGTCKDRFPTRLHP